MPIYILNITMLWYVNLVDAEKGNNYYFLFLPSGHFFIAGFHLWAPAIKKMKTSILFKKKLTALGYLDYVEEDPSPDRQDVTIYHRKKAYPGLNIFMTPKGDEVLSQLEYWNNGITGYLVLSEPPRLQGGASKTILIASGSFHAHDDT